jgi:hypothetical protein
MLEPIAAGSGELRAFLRVGGISVARQQLALALALHCERVICIARGLPSELVALQHEAERSGCQFNVIAAARQLLGLVTAADDVVLIGEGLFSGAEDAAALLEKGPGVLVQPIEQGLAAGFERIDLNSASAGAMRISGRLIERLAELPGDCDAFSALQRIALQSGVIQRQIPALGGDAPFWMLVRSEADAHAFEPRWIAARIGAVSGGGPGLWLARLAVQALGPALLHAGSGANVVVVAAVATGLMGLGAGWLGFVPLGLGLCGFGWVLRQAAVLLARIDGTSEVRSGIGSLRREIYGWSLDAVIVAILAWGTVLEPGQSVLHRYFPPLMLVALLRIVPRTIRGRWAHWIEDRLVLCLVLAGAVGAGMGGETVHVGAILLALAGIALPRGEVRLTRP